MKFFKSSSKKENLTRTQRLKRILKVVFYIVFWLSVWTPIACIIALPIVLTLLNIFERNNMATVATQSNILVGITCMAVALVFFGAIWLLRNRKSLFMRVGRSVLLVCTWIGLIFGVAVLGSTAMDSRKPSTANQTQPLPYQLQQNPELLAVTKEVGAVYVSDLNMSYVDGYAQVDRRGEYKYFNDAAGKPMRGDMTIKKGTVGDELRRYVAHEYLHHIWYTKLTTSEKDLLTSHLIVAYGQDWYMKQRTNSGYADSGTLAPTELFSFYCTEEADRWLPQPVLEQCNKYINRSVLQFSRT